MKKVETKLIHHSLYMTRSIEFNSRKFNQYAREEVDRLSNEQVVG
jgi:hypothetical protein